MVDEEEEEEEAFLWENFLASEGLWIALNPFKQDLQVAFFRLYLWRIDSDCKQTDGSNTLGSNST